MLKSGRPRHEQLSDRLREQIEGGEYQADDQLPSESQLCEQYDVSRITVRRALQTLENEGFIYRRQGLGSFVSGKRLQQGLVRLTDFVEDMARAGLVASSRITHRGTEPASPDIASNLEVEEGTLVVRVDRLRLGDGKPIAFDRTWLPVFYAQFLEGHDLEKDTIYSILEREYDVPVVRGDYLIQAVNAEADIATHLQVLAGQALLLIERVTMTHKDKRIYFQRRYYRSDRVVYALQLQRSPGRKSDHTQGMPLEEFEPIFRRG